MNKFVRHSQFSLLLSRRFGPLWLAHATAALADQLMRGLLAGAILGLVFLPPFLGEARVETGVWFVVPGLLLAAYAGQFADFMEPRRLVVLSRFVGLAAALAAAAAVHWQQLSALYVAVALAGAQEALFVPARGKLIRHALDDQELAGGNGLILAAWQLSALGGLAYVLIGPDDLTAWIVRVLLVAATLSLVAGLLVPGTGVTPRRPRSWAPGAVHRDTLTAVLTDRNILLAVLGVGWFWFTSLTYLIYLPDHAAAAFSADNRDVMLLLAAPIAGMMVGALLGAPASGRRIELGLVPLGALVMAVAGLDFYFFAAPVGGANSYARSLVDLSLLGAGASLFVVPLMAWIIQSAPTGRLGRVQGGMYLCISLFVVAAVAITDWCRARGIDVSTLMLTSTLLHAAVSIYIFRLLPDFLLRLVMWLLIHTVYRVREEGLDNVPVAGPAIVVCNHVSYVDALVIGAKLRRPVRFVMHKHIFTVPGLGLLFRLYKAIPIASAKTDPETLAAAMDQVALELESGQIVGIFPEGHLTRDGEVDVFRSGIEKIVARTPVPVVPIALQGLWGSFFSNKGGPALTHGPRLSWSRLGLVVGKPVPPEDVAADDLRERVLALRGRER